MELLKDYDYTIFYHPRKANMVVDALSRKSMGSPTHIIEVIRLIVKECQELVDGRVTESLLAQVQVHSILVDNIKGSQEEDPHLRKIIEEVQGS